MSSSLHSTLKDRSLQRSRKPWTIRARVICLWKIPEHLLPLSFSTMEMVLIDREGDKMEAVVSKEEPIMESIVEGCVYKISKFRVVPNTGPRRYTRLSYRIIFHSGTKISQCEDDRIPRDGWYFVHLENISIIGDKFGYLVDVIGLLSAASRQKLLIKGNRIYKMMVIDILDNTGKCSCVLLGDVVETLNEYLCLDWLHRPVVGLRFVDVRRTNGKTVINCIPYVTKIYINHVFEEDWVVGNRFSGVIYDVPVEYIGLSDSNVSVKVDMLETNPKKTLGQLITTKEKGFAVVHASILAFIKDYPWSYISCRCDNELKLEDDVYRCNRCFQNMSKFIRRYRIKLDVFDGYDSSTFVLNDAQVNELVGVSCEELLGLIEEPLSDKYPPQLEKKLLGKEMLFKVRTGAGTNYFGEEFYDVMRICCDTDVISTFLSRDSCVTPLKGMFTAPFAELESSINGSDSESIEDENMVKLKSSDDSVIAIMNSSFSLSGYTDSSVNKPYVQRPLKRKLIQEFDDVADHSQVLPIIGHGLRSRFPENYRGFYKGECSRPQVGQLACQNQETRKHNLSSTDDQGLIDFKSEVHVSGEKLKIVSDVAVLCTTNNSTGGYPSRIENKFQDIELVDLTLLDDDVKVVPSQGGYSKEFVDLSNSSKSDDNFGVLVERDEQYVGCIEVVYLSD